MAEVINGLGKLVGWNSITVRLLGRDVVGISKIQYEDNQESNNEQGAGKFAVGISDGNYTASASIDLFEEEVRALQGALPPGTRIQDLALFDITVNYALPGGGTRSDILHNCRFTKNGVEAKQNDGKLVRSFPLALTHISHNA